MGLHLNYELRLPSTASDEEVDARLAALHAYALDLPFREVSPIVRAAFAGSESGVRWVAAFSFLSDMVATPWDEDSPPLTGDALSARGFLVNPGEQCETATFGFLRRADVAGRHQEWYWQCFCKTQYASVISDAHLITCHSSLVRLIDHAIALGIEVAVYDETGYWETRDDLHLLAEVHKMNRLVASFAGKLSDAIGSEHGVVAPIFEHPRFERLEMGEGETE